VVHMVHKSFSSDFIKEAAVQSKLHFDLGGTHGTQLIQFRFY
jgi:hypothetical protein